MIGILILTITAFICSIILVLVETKTNNSDDIDEIVSKLPGINCGTCGYAGCKGMACAILEDKENYKKCKILRKEKLEEFEKYINEKKFN